MLVLSSLIGFIFYQLSFRFFIWLICVEILTINILLMSSFYNSSSIFLCVLLVLGACEVGVALSLMVTVSRFSGLEKTSNLQCEAY